MAPPAFASCFGKEREKRREEVERERRDFPFWPSRRRRRRKRQQHLGKKRRRREISSLQKGERGNEKQWRKEEGPFYY